MSAGPYPWRGVLAALIGLLILLVIGTALIDVAFAWRMGQDDPRFRQFPGTCYYAGDVRNYMRIALSGYSNYTAALLPPHLTYLNDRSWWPLFPHVVARFIAWGGGMCSSRTANALAFLALAPLWQAATGERRARRLLILAVLPFGAWLYVGEADTWFLALSVLLVAILERGGRWPRRAGIAALIAGLLVGLTKPNGLVLVPALGVWGLMRTAEHLRAPAEGSDPRWRRALDDANPGWRPLLGGLGITLGTAWWIYQTSGFYPYYVLMTQRALWWREFEGGSPSSFAYVFHLAIHFARSGLINMNELQRLVELASVLFGLALAAAGLPPRWPGGERGALPLYWRVGILAVFMFMFTSGQSHAVERYAVSNVFVVLAWYRRVFGAPDHPATWDARQFAGLLRWTWLLLGPALWGLAFLLLGWHPLR